MTRDQFLAKKPYFMASIGGAGLYEHPIHGDEAPIMAVFKDGRVIETDFYELDDIDAEYIAELQSR